jgi:hypothetical protein
MSDHMMELEQKFKNRNLLEELAYYANYPPKGYVPKVEVDLIQWAMYKAYQIIKGRPAMSSCDYISRAEAVALAMQYCPDDDGTCPKAGHDLRELLDDLENAPPADVRPMVYARWIDLDDHLMCSGCGASHNEPNKNFCPNCGANMRPKSDILDKLMTIYCADGDGIDETVAADWIVADPSLGGKVRMSEA